MQRKVKATIPPPRVRPGEAAELLLHVEGLRREARVSLGAPWFPLVVFGAVVALSAPVVAFAGTNALLPLWLVAAVAGLAAVRRHYRSRARVRGATGRARVWVIGVGMSITCFSAALAAARLGGEDAALAAPIAVTVVGYVALGVLQRSWQPAAWVAVSAATALLLLVAGSPPWAVELAFGGGMVAVGLVLRHGQARS